jgi:hypothetical protein
MFYTLPLPPPNPAASPPHLHEYELPLTPVFFIKIEYRMS